MVVMVIVMEELDLLIGISVTYLSIGILAKILVKFFGLFFEGETKNK